MMIPVAEHRMSVELTEAAREFIARHGFHPVYGARPLRRYISYEVETKIGRAPRVRCPKGW
jgi:ATP-dependent Clp protease ATP-binding subunit ClpB